MTQPPEDSRNRPVVLQTRAEPAPRHLRKPARVLAGATLVVAALSGAAGLAFGGSAVWSVVGPQGSNNVHDPIWVAPPSQVPIPARVDDQRTTTDPNHPTPTTTTSRGRSGEAEPNDPDRPATAGKKATATHQAATHDQAPATTADKQRGKGGSGGGSSTGGGGSSGGGGSDDAAHGGGDG
jgi:uncharacterized membrane protein YgcG